MSYAIRFTPKAAKQVKTLNPVAARRIRLFMEEKLQPLENPRLLGKKLINEDFWRYRVGGYRILTTIDNKQIAPPLLARPALRPMLRSEEYEMPGISVEVADTISELATKTGISPEQTPRVHEP
ncbi:type II toxin-antitoxin system RelE/ParE family toxin [Paenarthrobacter sp. PH39-S1]|uniref:type II toxin-antitoxin system RelE family toxin n=1 Tax=Paenarthrobacter sp. PH39-S1 TaxID=3046204 RepID=UPI0024B98375|nr:type II toxin-antitoxin system RelE/ParE family toxin [Paenarthrobacter sp. PH39-S1]MDJ0355702.1 type II toxin-antitoxin system RelE/ParE family toxin [Paenarthrobacter sp. PH39-S1]